MLAAMLLGFGQQRGKARRGLLAVAAKGGVAHDDGPLSGRGGRPAPPSPPRRRRQAPSARFGATRPPGGEGRFHRGSQRTDEHEPDQAASPARRRSANPASARRRGPRSSAPCGVSGPGRPGLRRLRWTAPGGPGAGRGRAPPASAPGRRAGRVPRRRRRAHRHRRSDPGGRVREDPGSPRAPASPTGMARTSCCRSVNSCTDRTWSAWLSSDPVVASRMARSSSRSG